LQQKQLWQPLELEVVKDFFHQRAGEDMEVSWEELKEVLDFITKCGKTAVEYEFFKSVSQIPKVAS
jgi:hypothetical protein